MTIIYLYCLEKTGRPNQAQGAPGHGIPGCLCGWSEPYTDGLRTSLSADRQASELTLLVSVRRTGSSGLSLSFEKGIHMKHLFSFENVINSPCQFMSQDGHGFGVAVFLL
jgi:hypothetical protein